MILPADDTSSHNTSSSITSSRWYFQLDDRSAGWSCLDHVIPDLVWQCTTLYCTTLQQYGTKETTLDDINFSWQSKCESKVDDTVVWFNLHGRTLKSDMKDNRQKKPKVWKGMPHRNDRTAVLYCCIEFDNALSSSFSPTSIKPTSRCSFW